MASSLCLKKVFITETQLVNHQDLKINLESWDVTYVGKADDLLYNHIVAFSVSEMDTYARYTSIVQSSGIGKSRAIDELSKTFSRTSESPYGAGW